MELKNNTCSVCGQPLPEAINNRVTCEYCNSTFSLEASLDELEEIKKYIDESKLESLANARNNLYKVTHEEYLSKERIRTAVDEVLKLYPSDIMANFYDAFLRNNKNAVNDYLLNFDVEKNKDYLKPIIEFTIKNLDSANVTALKALVDKACDKEDKYNYNTKIEEEALKLNEGLYNLDIDREVFVCYSSKDIKIVNEITSYIEEQGLSCFVALRNLRHGVGSVENYQESIYKAMEHSKCVLFLSSLNSRNYSCDALKYEIPYLKDKLTDKKRIEYLIDEYSDKDSRIAVSLLKQAFAGLEWSKSKEDLCDRLSLIVFTNDIIDTVEEEPIIENEEVKYCVNCFKANPLSAKHCIKCDCDSFKDSIIDAYKKDIDNYRVSLDKKYQDEFNQDKLNGILLIKYCKNCKAINLFNAKICSYCGKSEFLPSLEAIQQKEENERQEREQKEEERKKEEQRKAEEVRIAKEKAIAEKKRFEEERKIVERMKIVSLSQIQKGCIVCFGNYPQSTDTPEPIEWDVLDVVDGKALLFAHKILDAHRFDSSSNNYANSEIRTWLNNDFLNKAFTKEEQERILVTEVDNSERSTNSYRNPNEWNNGKNQYACNNTQDKIFLLSQYEITNPNYGFSKDYYNTDIKRRKQVTEYAKKNGAYVYDENAYNYKNEYKGNGRFFLRSPCYSSADRGYYVYYDGCSCIYDCVDSTNDGAVPALWIKI